MEHDHLPRDQNGDQLIPVLRSTTNWIGTPMDYFPKSASHQFKIVGTGLLGATVESRG
jgi:hypothetical protein